MVTRYDIHVFSIAAGSAALLGLGLGAWSAPPGYMSEPTRTAETPVVDQIDPNLARYRQMLEVEGVDPIPHVVVAGFYPAPEPDLASREEMTAAYTPVDDAADTLEEDAGRQIPVADTRWPSPPAPTRSYMLADRTRDDAAAPIAAAEPAAPAYAAPQTYAAPQPSVGGADVALTAALRPSAPPQGG